MRHFYLIFAVTLLAANTSCAASFDCAKASTKAEKMICADFELSEMDETLARGYALSQGDKQNAVSTKKSQKQWLKERNRCKGRDCLWKQYDSRIQAMDKIIDRGTFLAAGGRYRMIDSDFACPNGEPCVEKYAEVCTAFLDNLDKLPPDPPMACDVKIAPGMSDFKAPEWREIDVWENRDLAMQIMYRNPPANDEEKEKQLANIRAYIDAGMLAFQTTEIDIDNDGTKDNVLAKLSRKCDPNNIIRGPSWRGYITYDPETRKLNLAQSKFYFPFRTNKALFNYKGVTYLAGLGGSITREAYFGNDDHATKSIIKLYRPNPVETAHPVAWGCEYVYLPASGGEE